MAEASTGMRVATDATVVKATPFQPPPRLGVAPPMACGGYCVVALRHDQKWLAGEEGLQAIYDGKTYRFSGRRQLAMFVAAPHHYVPALGGDCPVTLVETGVRTPGEMKHGTMVGERLFFFVDEARRRQFQTNPQNYVAADLVNAGNCPVSLVNERREVAGVETTALVYDGLRYYFSGLHQRKQFLADPARYQKAIGMAVTPRVELRAMPPGSLKANPLRSAERDESTELDSRYALSRYCVVTLLTEARWELGHREYAASQGGATYLFASLKAQQTFLYNPERFLPVHRGYCIVSQRDSGEQVLGSIQHAAEFEGKLYLFAGDEEEKRFLEMPEKYTAVASEQSEQSGQSGQKIRRTSGVSTIRIKASGGVSQSKTSVAK